MAGFEGLAVTSRRDQGQKDSGLSAAGGELLELGKVDS